MATKIDLGHRQSFRIGATEVRPSTCEVIGPGGREAIEPRVMQVLTVLSEARGETVTRDDLTELCWDGRIVSEDAINRVIQRIRRLAREVGDGGFEIRTIHKIGYRLCPIAALPGDERIGSSAALSPAPNLPGRWRPHRASRVLWSGLAALGLIAAASWLAADETAAPGPVDEQVSLELAANDLATRARAAVLEGTPSQLAQGIGYFRQALARTPEAANLWGALAMSLFMDVPNVPPAERAIRVARIRQAAERSLALDPREGHAHAALANLHPTFGHWARKDELHRRAVESSDLSSSPAPLVWRSKFLAEVGRTGEALALIERASSYHPLVPWIQSARVSLLVANHRLEEAEQVAAYAHGLWPRDHDLWFARFYLFALNGNPTAAQAMIDDRSGWPVGVRPADMDLLGRAVSAIASRSRAEADEIVGSYRRLAPEGQAYLEQAIIVSTALGRTDAALDFAQELYGGTSAPVVTKRFVDHVQYAQAGDRDMTAVFVHASPALWSHPAFLDLIERTGLPDYWRRGHPPDFCGEERVRALCARHGLGTGSRMRSSTLMARAEPRP